jgi:hypothetical protein
LVLLNDAGRYGKDALYPTPSTKFCIGVSNEKTLVLLARFRGLLLSGGQISL